MKKNFYIPAVISILTVFLVASCTPENTDTSKNVKQAQVQQGKTIAKEKEAQIKPIQQNEPAKLPETITMVSFKTDADIKPWDVRESTPKTTLELSDWPEKRNNKCAKLIYPKWQEGSEQWPAMRLRNENIPIKDWRAFDYMTFEIYSTYDGILPLRIFFKDKNGGRFNSPDLDLKKGYQVVKLEKETFGSLDCAKITEIHLFMTRPKEEYKIYVGDIKFGVSNLESNLANIKREAKEYSKKIKRTNDSMLPKAERGKCVKTFNKLVAQIKRAKKNLPLLSEATPAKKVTSILSPMLKCADLLEILKVSYPIAEAATKFNGKKFAWGTTSSLEKVYRDNFKFTGNFKKGIKLSLSKNEHEASQVAILPFENIKGINIKATDLTGTNNSIIKADEIKIAPVGYVDCKQPPYAVERTGWHPDPILNYLSAINVEAYKWQSFWVEVRAGKNTPAGTYNGSLAISIGDKIEATIPITVKVWNFTLQDSSRLPLALSWSSGDFTLAPTYLNDKSKIADYRKAVNEWTPIYEIKDNELKNTLIMRRKTTDMLMDHRLTADRIYRGRPPEVAEVKYMLSKGAKWFNILHIKCLKKLKKGDPFPEESKKEVLKLLAKYVPQYKKAGLLKYGYIYSFDEVKEEFYSAMIEILGEIKKRYPEIPILSSVQDFTYGEKNGLDKVIDFWVPLTSKVDTKSKQIAEQKKNGERFWWYICCNPKHPYANWFIEYPAMEHRLVMGFMPYKYNPEGFLYYCLAMWRKYEKKEDGKWKGSPRGIKMSGGPLTNWKGYSWRDVNGDGNIVYPGEYGPIPSTRLKNIRDGLEDYIYLKMLEDCVIAAKSNKLKVTSQWMNQAEKILNVNPQLVESLTKYSIDGNVLLTEREKIGNLIEQVIR